MKSIEVKAYVQQIDNKNKKAVLVTTIPYIKLKDVVRKTCMTTDTDTQEYQRKVDPTRIVALKKHIRSVFKAQAKGDARVLFPTSIILATDNSLSFSNVKMGGVATCEISEGTMIVDGQHRFYGMDALYKEPLSLFEEDEKIRELVGNYHFSCTILVNYDLWEQACIFVDVNFNQKKVNKSLLYNIYGVMLTTDSEQNLYIPKQNQIYIAHSIVERLQTQEKSVLQGYIKMLGSGQGWVSQSFFVEALMKHMRPTGIWYYAPEEFQSNKHLVENLYMEAAALLACLRFTFIDYWPKGEELRAESVLCKTTGLGASIQLLENLHDSLSENLKTIIREGWISVLDYAELIATFNSQLAPLKAYGEELFSLNTNKGKFAGTGGAGLQTNLYKRMKELLSLSESKNN